VALAVGVGEGVGEGVPGVGLGVGDALGAGAALAEFAVEPFPPQDASSNDSRKIAEQV